ncbi:prepilin-type N-terminal cleavage/methylation domain-containing protein [Patescibacteria group bacterium]|nr:prepilin-type N-terminal cleavage/methylation domain-containing protein [Patescibacteria group bacterium]
MRNRKGLTLIELLIAIGLLTIIMSAMSAIFAVALKNYQVSIAQNNLQKDLNIVLDDISRNVKEAVELPLSYTTASNETFNRSGDTLILAIPAIGDEQRFLYDENDAMKKDYIVYQIIGTELHKKAFTDIDSGRINQDESDKIVLENINIGGNPVFTFNDSDRHVETRLSLSRIVSKTNVKASGMNVAVKRNEESVSE